MKKKNTKTAKSPKKTAQPKITKKMEDNLNDMEIYQIINSNGPIAFPLHNPLNTMGEHDSELNQKIIGESASNNKLADLKQEQLRTNSFLLNYPLKK